MQQHKIIIIGGGIGGLMTAIALNKKGIESTIFERSISMDTNGAGLALWANATKILDEFELLENLLPFSFVMNEMATSTFDGQLLKVVQLKKLEGVFHFPSIVLLRSDLQKVLLSAVPASQIRYNKQFVRVEPKADSTEVFFADGSSETAHAVIFADGIHSVARTSIFSLPPLQYAGRTSWRGVAQFDKPVLGNITYEIFGVGKRIGIFPLPGNLAYWYVAVNMPEQESFRQKSTREGVLSHLKGWSEPASTLIGSTPEDKLTLTNINYTPHINKIVHENMALLGDAAHPMTPDLGQGACQAIEDAWVLADCLSKSKSITSAFLAYEVMRLKRIKSIAVNSFRMGRIRQIGNPFAAMLRNGAFRALPERFILKMLEWNIYHEINTATRKG